MINESLYISALIMGLLGGTHCAGMCGGIVSALTLGLPENKLNQSNALTGYLLLYNLGRILSYSIAGALIASIGLVIENIADALVIRRIFTIIAAVVMILLGLYLTGWWTKAILSIEKGGAWIWRFIKPLAGRFIPIRSASQALIAGLLWGWLPCGLVYTALLWALSAESIAQGALIMASFGIGTLPTLFGIGFFSASLLSHLQKQWLRTVTGVMVMGFGFYQLMVLI